MKCGCCGEEVYSNGICCVKGCNNGAKYEGWIDKVDFSGNKVGSAFLGKVCEEHRKVLRGA